MDLYDALLCAYATVLYLASVYMLYLIATEGSEEPEDRLIWVVQSLEYNPAIDSAWAREEDAEERCDGMSSMWIVKGMVVKGEQTKKENES